MYDQTDENILRDIPGYNFFSSVLILNCLSHRTAVYTIPRQTAVVAWSVVGELRVRLFGGQSEVMGKSASYKADGYFHNF